ncbi:acetoacetate--CoA ligase [Alkalihalobacterium chitinilyticum]|uniref:Acetoacetate--CoA ligase n=1 Tax=Alkalihalobacterium chitinilyticum TaxID=2980103 RepID=A0ABT5VJV6_9BACI|nr:acetoacetate--CoA ligase [Alkalihalobacterium chitinilyticum]MDE5414539.1 acetoacetate--CoA ligase [Alkalihalobacterium chitinilyticum]
MKHFSEGEIIWQPSKEKVESSVMFKYMKWLKDKKGLKFGDYNDLWKWSVDELEDFWGSIWEFCDIKATQPYNQVLAERKMPETRWFEGARLNYAENIFSKYQADRVAIYFRSEHIRRRELSWKELSEKVASVAHSLKQMGVKRGDRVVAYLPNVPETVIAFLAAASIGAIWSSCSPDFGSRSVIDRFKQIEPVVLFAIDSYQYNGKTFDKTSVVSEMQKELPSIKHTILVPYKGQAAIENKLGDVIPWEQLLKEKAELTFESVSFDHPLWILYSSGTTGMPKPIVQGHGGILVEHLKSTLIHQDLSPDDAVFWFTSTGWVMWNLLIGGLLAGSTIVLYDGSPSYPSMDTLWELAEDANVTFFGTSAPFLLNCQKLNVKPKQKYNLLNLKSLCSTGAPLSDIGYLWVYENVKNDIWLSSSSGGTDICTGFVGGIPTLPVRVGEIQGPALGVHAEAYDEDGNSLTNQVGELVITKPMPSMPLFFWNDHDNQRYFNSYFDTYPGVWKHGDWIKFDDKRSCIIYGRSDSTINRSGVRTGTSDIYRVVEVLDEVMESLVIDLEVLGRDSSLLLFVVLNPKTHLDAQLVTKIREQIRKHVSPRFMPDNVYAVEQIPKTLNGKKMEVPIRKMLLGFEMEKVVNPDSMSNPESLQFFKGLSASLMEKHKEKLF